MDLDLEALLREAVELLPTIRIAQKPQKSSMPTREAPSPSDEKYTLVKDLLDFVFDRLRGYYADRGFGSDQFDAVRAVETDTLIDFDRRLCAVGEFARLADAQALAAANKRIGNILRQAGDVGAGRVEMSLLDAGTEADLHHAVESAASAIAPLVAQGRYIDTLRLLAGLRAPVDRYFDQVMVMVDDSAKRRNRLVLLSQLRRMFLQVADISLLQHP
jgi:glycyl-tRNA synthetase beta chain